MESFRGSAGVLDLSNRVLQTGEGEAHVVAENAAPNAYREFSCWPVEPGSGPLDGLMLQITDAGSVTNAHAGGTGPASTTTW